MVNNYQILLGLGSNIGNKLNYIQKSITLLYTKSIVTDITISNIYESTALLTKDAPSAWNKNFYNLCINGKTTLTPTQLLKQIKEVEKAVGRISRSNWAPREIDIDILLYDNIEFTSKDLSIPHKHFLDRDFTILPANDLIPNYKYPKPGIYYHKTIKEILSSKKIEHSKCWKTHHIITTP